jgi:hypothetical protein
MHSVLAEYVALAVAKIHGKPVPFGFLPQSSKEDVLMMAIQGIATSVSVA